MRLILPPLIEGHQVPFAQAQGETAEGGDYPRLETIAAGLRIAQLDAQKEELVSVPDVWAQVEVFRAALVESRHPLHQRAIGEWRGLMAIFALRAYHGFDVSTQLIALDGPAKNGADRGLIAILNKIKPTIALTPRHNWNEIGLIRVDGHALGLLVPTTIVCPPRRPSPMLAGHMPWILEDRIVDPLSTEDISSDELAVLAEFSREATEILMSDPAYTAEFAKPRPGLLGGLKEAFDAFHADAVKRRGQAVRGLFSPKTLYLDLPSQPLYPLLANAKVFERGRVSQTLLPVRPELRNPETGIEGILIIDRNMPQALGTRASEITVWGNMSLQRVLDQPAARDAVELEARAAGYLCLGPNDLFTTHFYRTDNVQVEAQPLGFRDALLPVTPAVMMLMSPDELRNSIEITTSWREVIVTLRLRLSNTDGQERFYTVRKTYGEKEVISREAPPTTLSLWPDFEHQDWRWHFAYYGGNLQQHFAPRMFVSMPAMAAFIAGAGADQTARVLRAAQLVREPQLLAERLALAQTVAPVELYKSEAAPEALYCDCVTDQRARGFVESKARTPVGILLFPTPKRPPLNSEACSIGIDFGTVNTSVYWRAGSNVRPERMVFKNRLILPFFPDSEEKRKTYRDFLPLSDTDIPFMTVLRDRQVPGVGDSTLPLWGSFIYYVTEVNRALEDLAAEGGSPLRFELKWATTREERRPVQGFLAQVALQSLAEVVARGIAPTNVSWRFSYPEAYSPFQLGDFENAAKHAVRIALNPNADSATNFEDPSIPDPEPSTDSESLSTALYFISEKSSEAPPTGDLVTIDMGGLTSDVSIWHSQRLIWRNSLKLAGRHILISYLDKNFDLIGRIGGGNPEIGALIKLVEVLPEEKRRNGIEMLMNSPSFTAAFSNNFHLVAGEPLGRGLRVVAELALLGILHYVGRTMQHCAKTGDGYQDIKDAHVSVCLGGRTSILYRALFEGGARRSHLASSLGVFKDAAPGLIARTHDVYSDRPKHEVAYGLLVPQTGARNLAVKGYRVEDVILGEEVQTDDRLLPYDSLTSDLGTGARWRGAGLKELKAFLQSVQNHSDIIVEFDPDNERRVLDGVDEHLADDRYRLEQISADGKLNDAHMRTESTVIEPPFIVALRELISIIIDRSIVVRTLS